MEAKLIDEAADVHSEDADARRFVRASVNESVPISPDAKADELTRSEKRVLTIIVVSAIVFSVALTIGLIEQSLTQAVEIPLHGSVVSSSAICTDMARGVLRQGGSAVDAAVTAVLCISVVRPELSSIGGGGFMLLHQHRKKESVEYDFRETAPAAATAARLHIGGSALPTALKGNRSIAVPGTVAGLYLAHQNYGKLLWSKIVKPIAALARDGFDLDPATAQSAAELCAAAACPAYLVAQELLSADKPRRVSRPAYASALDLLAEGGARKFYQGSIAYDILQLAVDLNSSDLTNYAAKTPQPIKMLYNGYAVLSTAAPSAGVAVLHALGILDGYNWTAADDGAQSLHYIIEALKFCDAVFAGLGDPTYDSRVANLSSRALDQAHCEALRRSINDTSPLDASAYMSDTAELAGQANVSAASSDSVVDFVSVVDSDELFVAVETSLGSKWGSGVFTKTYDIVLNNAMADFGSSPNSMKPSARPRSIASPVIFYTPSPSCRKRGTVGSVGSQSSISGTVQALIALLSFGNDPSKATAKARVVTQEYPRQTVRYDQELPDAALESLIKLQHNMVSVPSFYNAMSVIQKVDSDVTVATEREGQDVVAY